MLEALSTSDTMVRIFNLQNGRSVVILVIDDDLGSQSIQTMDLQSEQVKKPL